MEPLKLPAWLPPLPALVLPVLAMVLQTQLWPWLQPLVWVLFYPAVFFSSWLGGLRGGLWATLLSVLLAWFFFLAPGAPFAVQDQHVFPTVVVFIGMSLLFSVAHDRLRQANREAIATLTAVQSAKEELKARVRGHTVELAASRESIERSEARMAGIVNSAMDAIISVDSQQLVVLFNTAAEAMFQCSAAEALGKPLDRFIPERFRSGHKKHVEGFGQTRQTSRSMRSLGTLSGVRADGEEFPIEASISQVEVAGQKTYTVILRDITERKRDEAARHTIEARYRTLFEYAPDGIVIADPQSYYIDANPSICRMLGYTRDELIGMHASDIVVAAEVRHIAPALNVIKAGSDYQREWRFRRKDGSAFDAEVIATAMPDGNLLGMIRDITERRNVEQALRIKQEHSQSLLRLARKLEQALTIGDVLNATREELETTLGLHAAWFYLFSEDRRFLRLVVASRPLDDTLNEEAGEMMLIEGDQMLEEIAAAEDLVVVEDARTDPRTNKQMVAKLGSRTIVNMPVSLSGRKLGTIGAGTFGDEGVRVLSLAEREFFAALASHVAAVLDRVQALEKRQHAEAALRQSEARFAKAFHSNPAAMCITTIKRGRFIEVNERYCQMFGLTPEELIGQSAVDLGLWADPATRTQTMEQLQGQGFVRDHETNFRRKNGDVLDALISMELIDFPGEPERVVVSMFFDITERKRTEAALRESEEHFRFLNDLSEATRTLADPAQIMTAMARMLGRHLRASRCAYADVDQDGEQFTILHDYTDGCASTVGSYQLSLFGARAVATLNNAQTLIIRNVGAELLPDEGADMFNAIGIQAIITCPLVKDGSLRAMMAVHQTTPRDWKPAEIAIVEDVVERCWATIERRTAEEQIHRMNVELEQRVAERTAQLEAANKELEAFSYSVSHDLRAPLRAVDGFSRVLLEDYGAQVAGEGQRYLQIIRNGAQRMGHLIDDLLTFSRLSRAPLSKRSIDTRALVQTTLEDLAGQREGRQIELHVADLPACEGDPALLKQVWINLLSNAFKYTQKREPAVIEIGSTVSEGKTTFFVRDNGAGFDMRYAHKLFGVFQRLHRAEDYEGTGVGLAIVQRIIHRHGGKVWAEAALNQGATFYFTLGGETPL